MRLLVRPPSGHPDPRQLQEFLRLAHAHRKDLGGLWVAEQAGRLLSAALPVVSPGRTMLVFIPAHLNAQEEERLTRQLIETICGRAVVEGIHLAQILLEVGDPTMQALVESCSFHRLAELLYLQTTVPRGYAKPVLPENHHWLTYSPQTHQLFAQTILTTYQHSLDCPHLSGLRSIDDIIAGHKATGQHDPNLWFLLAHPDQPLAVLLLSTVPQTDIFELVYLGLTPAARGRGIGNLLLQQALHVASTLHRTRLSLAVDADNMPALKLYWRHGLQAIGRKLALIRDLRVPTITLGPALEPHPTPTPADKT